MNKLSHLNFLLTFCLKTSISNILVDMPSQYINIIFSHSNINFSSKNFNFKISVKPDSDECSSTMFLLKNSLPLILNMQIGFVQLPILQIHQTQSKRANFQVSFKQFKNFADEQIN